MTENQSQRLEQLILDWYHWARADREFLGYSRVSPMFRGVASACGGVHDDEDEVDARIKRYNSEVVDACVGELPIQMRAAIGVHARNKAAGAAVHRNPRYNREDQQLIYQAAKEELCAMLVRRGLVDPG